MVMVKSDADISMITRQRALVDFNRRWGMASRSGSHPGKGYVTHRNTLGKPPLADRRKTASGFHDFGTAKAYLLLILSV